MLTWCCRCGVLSEIKGMPALLTPDLCSKCIKYEELDSEIRKYYTQ